MDWQAFVAWFERNAVEIAAVECLFLAMGLVKMIFDYLHRRWHRRRAAKVDDQLERLLAANEASASRRLSVASFMEAATRLSMEPMGEDGARWGELPEGTRLIYLPDGTFRLATPVDIGPIHVVLPPPTATLTVTKEDKE